MSFMLSTQNSGFALRQLDVHNALLTQALERLSSGYRINRSADDPSGLALADKFRSHVRGLQQASRNITQATNFIRTAEDGMTQILNLLFDVRDLAIEASNTTMSTSDRLVNQTEINELLAEIDRLATAVRFNGIKLLNGTYASKSPREVSTGKFDSLFGGGTFVGSAIFQVGAYKGNTMKAFISTQTAESLGIKGLDVTTQTKAFTAAQSASAGVGRMLSRRARVGAVERRLESAKSFVDQSATSHEAAESGLRDADTAAEIVNFTKQQILVQAATAMIAQGNLLSQSVLSLLFKFS